MNRQPYISYIIFVTAFLYVFGFARGEKQQRDDLSSRIEIGIETSRSQMMSGTEIGVVAEIKNLSDSTVYLHEKYITLTLPPELQEPCSRGVSLYAHFPTEIDISNDPSENSIGIKPGDNYKIFWLSRTSPCSTLDLIFSWADFLFFLPGDYTITVVAKYWTNPVLIGLRDYHTVTQSATLPVAAHQFVILFGAALGGLIAYFLLPQLRRSVIKTPTTKVQAFAKLGFVKSFAKILGAMLLSTIITILLSRIAETQFLIRVTVNDFWGAVAIGFVANYAGTKFLNKILSQTSSEQEIPHASSSSDSGKTKETK